MVLLMPVYVLAGVAIGWWQRRELPSQGHLPGWVIVAFTIIALAVFVLVAKFLTVLAIFLGVFVSGFVANSSRTGSTSSPATLCCCWRSPRSWGEAAPARRAAPVTLTAGRGLQIPSPNGGGASQFTAVDVGVRLQRTR